jgi:hypothetical protein
MAIIIREFTVEELEEEYDLPYDAVSNEELDKHRWYTVRELVFKADDGFFYEVSYMDPATEMQEGQDRWDEDHRGKVEAIRVEAKEVTAVEWVPVHA